MASSTFTCEINVPKTAIDDLGHVNNVTYLQWVLDVAEKHWTEKASKQIRENVYWVVLNHFISYKNPAFEDETLILKTWVETCEGVKSKRHTEIRRENDNKLIVKAETLWCLVDAETLRPKRISSEIKSVFLKIEH